MASQPFGKAAQDFFSTQTPKPKPSNILSLQQGCTMELTQHCYARGLRKQRNKQEVDEVDEGQGIVPEEASCRQNPKSRINSKSIKKQRQTKAPF